MIVSASLTERCNLNCDYCYAPVGRGPDMTKETLFRIVDWAVSATPPGDSLDFGFFGGEPLLRVDLMREAAARARERAGSAGIPLHLRVTTNGTVLDEPVLTFLEEDAVDLCVSVDGPPRVHDRHRRFMDGRGSSAVVAANLERALRRLRRVQVNAVYGPDTIDELPATVAYLIDLGVSLIHLNLDIMASWSRESFSRLRKAYFRVADLFVRSYRSGNAVAINLIDNKVILFLKDGYGAEDRCGMGQTKVGFAPNGDIYPCERLIGGDTCSGLCFGNTRSGPDPIRLQSIQERTGNRNPECERCVVRRFCMNWCGCTNYHLTGKTDVAAPILCASEKAAVGAAHSAMVELVDNNLFIDHLMAYHQEGQHRPRGGRV